MRRVWADTLLRAEQQHLLRLLLWSGLSIIAATCVVLMLVARRIRSPFLTQFSLQMAAWGAVVGSIALIEWHGVRLRDLSGAARLERMVWMNVGLDVGYAAVGCALVGCAWFLGRRLAVAGAGIGIILQGLALLIIDLQLAGVLSR